MGYADQHIAQIIAQEELDQFFSLPFLKESDRVAYESFVQHAAFPLVLTTDLLYNLWLNFAEDIKGNPLDCPREVVSDLLLSGLCKKVGNRSWEFTAGVRGILLNKLIQSGNFGTKRIKELADFTLLYAQERLDPKKPLERTISEVLRWGALAYVFPDEAAERMALALAQTLESKDGAGQLRMHHMMEKLAGPMSRYESFRDLRRFAAGVARNVAGQGQAAQTDFANMDQSALEIGNVTLNAPTVQKVEPPICFFGYITSPPSQTRSMTVLDFDDEHRRIVPFFRRLEAKGLIKIIVQYDMRPVEVENILTDPSFKDRIAFLHLSGHASTLEEQSQQQQQVQSNIPPPAFGGFNQDGKLVNWRSLVQIFQRYPDLNLITLDDVLTKNQLEELRSDARNRLNKVFNPFLPEGLRNLMVIDHNITNADLMPYLLSFYDKFTRDTSVNNAINEASNEHLGQLNQLKNRPVVTWLTDGWWKLSDHPTLTPELFDFEEKKVLSIEDAGIMANIGVIYRGKDLIGYGTLVDDDKFVTSYYYLEGSEHIRFYREGRWHEYVFEESDLVRSENMNVARVSDLIPESESSPLSDFSAPPLPSELVSNMAGFSWEMDLYYPVFDEDGTPLEVKRITVEASVDRFDLRYNVEDWDYLSGIPLIRSNGRVGGFHFGEMSDNPNEKVGVWWPGVKEELDRQTAQQPGDRIRYLETKLREEGDDLETLNELARAYRLSPTHKPEQAHDLLVRALQIDSKNTFSQNEMGMNLRARGLHEEALSYFNDVLAVDPQNTFALNEAGLTYVDLQEIEQAESFFRRSIEIDSTNHFALRELANIYSNSGDIPQAIAFTDRLLLLDPKNELVRNQLDQLRAEWAAREETFENIREHIQRGDLDLAFKVFEDLGTIPENIRLRVLALDLRHKDIILPKKSVSTSKKSPADQLNEIAEELMGILDDLAPAPRPTPQAEEEQGPYESITKKLENGLLDDALEDFLGIDILPEDLRVEALSMQSRLRDLRRRNRGGSLLEEDFNIGVNRITVRLAELLIQVYPRPDSFDYTDDKAAISNIQELIREGKTRLALTAFTNWSAEKVDLQEDAKSLVALYEELQRNLTLDKIDYENYIAGINRINARLLEIITTAQTSTTSDPTQELNTEDLIQRTSVLEKELKNVLEQGEEHPSDTKEIDTRNQLKDLYFILQQRELTTDQWNRKYGLALEGIGGYYFGWTEWEKAEESYREAVAYFSRKRNQGEGSDYDWLTFTLAITNEKLADTLRKQNDPGDLAQYQTALRLLQELEDNNPGYKGLNKALGILNDKLSQVAKEDEELQQLAQEYRINSRKYFARASKPISNTDVEEILQNGDLSEAIDQFQIYLYQQEVDSTIMAEVQGLENQLNTILSRPLPSTESSGGSTILESINEFKQRSIRIELQNIYQELVPPTGTLTGEYPGLEHRELFRQVLTYGEELLVRSDIDAVILLLQDFQNSLTPDRQDRLENIQQSRQNQGSESLTWTSRQSQEVLQALREIINEEQALFSTATSNTGNTGPDRQEVLGQLMGRLEKDDLKALLEGMPQLSSFLNIEQRSLWDTLIDQLTELVENESRWSRDPGNYSKRVDEVKSSIMEFLNGKRDEWFPIS